MKKKKGRQRQLRHPLGCLLETKSFRHLQQELPKHPQTPWVRHHDPDLEEPAYGPAICDPKQAIRELGHVEK